MKKRSLFSELSEGLEALSAERQGKMTLRKVSVEAPDPVEVSADEIRHVRETAHVSQAVMAHRLRVNVRTWQNWEQGKARPNAQAAVLIRLVEKHPETLRLLEAL
ncbi:XRE family transcriptional regulator [Caballeronia cordobensis]|uniref:XRE family transcriptional regulator n=1 Tax=Caballeronia cordobensis TaxID=1353886 RepID=A0A158HXW8_CABCO|nr:helix-turn-helix domain-containing protein [Caballeronia cordobensis]SAL49222.1 XRE family transcriptional regulator [Caballeronia cordobensis]